MGKISSFPKIKSIKRNVILQKSIPIRVTGIPIPAAEVMKDATEVTKDAAEVTKDATELPLHFIYIQKHITAIPFLCFDENLALAEYYLADKELGGDE